MMPSFTGTQGALPPPSQSYARQQLQNRVVAIGASTGGVAAIQHILIALDQAPLRIIVTQHMPAGYTRRFAQRLQQMTGYEVKEAEDGDRVMPGRVLIAPGDRHLTLVGARSTLACKLLDGAAVCGHKPSVDVMFQSAVDTLGPKAIGVLLTGMGRDGAEGLLSLRQSGALTVCESQQTAVVFGMPKVALDLGASDSAVDLPDIAQWILDAVSERPMDPPVPALQRAIGTPGRGAQTCDLHGFPGNIL
jgi:two-component system, chemotaxis family, protein-glutamate methylesterase/glutaminase